MSTYIYKAEYAFPFLIFFERGNKIDDDRRYDENGGE